MARPKQEHPTPAELDVLKVLWNKGASTVREVMEEFKKQQKRRAYTTVMSLLNVMAEKGLVTRKPQGRAFVYTAKSAREKTLREMLGDLLGRAFEGQTDALVAHLLEEADPDNSELDEIRRIIEDYKKEKGST